MVLERLVGRRTRRPPTAGGWGGVKLGAFSAAGVVEADAAGDERRWAGGSGELPPAELPCVGVEENNPMSHMALVGRTVDSGFHQWDVNYDQAKQLAVGTALESKAFSTGGHQWKIKLYPRGCTISDNGAYMSIYLVLLKRSSNKSINVFFETVLMDKNGQPSPVAARSGLYLQIVHSWGWPRLVSLSDVEANHLSEGFITILFAVTAMSDNSIPVPPSVLGKQIGTLLDTMDGSDVSITINGETFHTHGALLAARSPVFREELYGSRSEGTALSITLHGMNPETFRVMLAFIYTDSLTEDHDNFPATLVHSLLAAADRYALDKLKLLCARKLLDDITLDTFDTTLMCAEMYNCPELKEKCLEFIATEANFQFMMQPSYLRSSDMALVGRPLDSAFYEFDVEYDQAKHITIGTAMDCVAFSAGGHLWRVKLYPCGRDVSDNGSFMSMYLEHVSRSATNGVRAFFEIIMMDKNGQPLCLCERSDVILFDKQELGWPQFISVADLESKYVTQGRFRFMCAITVLTDSSIRVPPSDLGKQLGMLQECTLGTDVSFVVGDETFSAHRAVLAARSPVFRAELFGCMAEATMPSITIHEIAPATFRIMLRFIYTDAMPGDDELGDAPGKMLACLIAASGRYALDRLKLWCARKLWDNVTGKTVSNLLLVADMHSCMELKERCLDLILRKDAAWSIYLTDNYVQLVRLCPHLVEELQARHEHLVAELQGRHRNVRPRHV